MPFLVLYLDVCCSLQLMALCLLLISHVACDLSRFWILLMWLWQVYTRQNNEVCVHGRVREWGKQWLQWKVHSELSENDYTLGFGAEQTSYAGGRWCRTRILFYYEIFQFLATRLEMVNSEKCMYIWKT